MDEMKCRVCVDELENDMGSYVDKMMREFELLEDDEGAQDCEE